MSKVKKILFAVLLLFIAIQFIRPERNSSSAVQASDMLTQFNTPANVAGIIKSSCYDCHSNNTRYPWYMNIQPMGWMMAKHIKDGKENLNFSEFATYSKRRQLSKLKSVQNSIKDGSMPLSSYTLIHMDAKLSNDARTLIIGWVAKAKDSLQNK